MTEKLETKWPDHSIPTEELILDWKNPRIDANEKSTQDEIRNQLLESFEIEDLAEGLIKSNGNMAGERIIVVKEDNGYVVLEGNRRTCACQLIRNTGLLPAGYNGRFPATTDKAILEALARLDAVVAPSRAAAEPIITRRHTAPGILPWTPMAKQRRIVNMVAEGKSVEEIAAKLEMAAGPITKTIKEYHLLNYAKALPGWSTAEKSRLNHPQLKPNAYLRFFSLRGVRKQLGMKFNTKGEVETAKDRKIFDKAIGALARELLLPDAKTGEPRANTRSTPEEVFRRAFSNDPQLRPLVKPSTGAKTTKRGRTAVRADKFFESLTCSIQDNRLIRITEEISRFDHNKFPTAATFLLRALLEGTVDYCIHRYKLEKDLLSYRWKKGKSQGSVELDRKIRFLVTRANEVFSNQNPGKSLGHWINANRYCNLVIHGKWADANGPALETETSLVRPVIQGILDKSILK